MGRAAFLFHDELNDFLAREKRGKRLEKEFKGNPSVKHLIEALGVPHPEVGRLLVGGRAVDFSYQVKDGDEIEVYPLTPAERGGDGTSPPRFLLDNHLGKLAVYLRLAGLDASYRNDYQDEELAKRAAREGRVLLTRDQRLLMRSIIHVGYWVREKSPPKQLEEILKRFDLLARLRPFQRCVRCNTPLQSVTKDEVIHRLEPLTKKYYDEFRYCPVCDRVYWKGSHYEHMLELLRQVSTS